MSIALSTQLSAQTEKGPYARIALLRPHDGDTVDFEAGYIRHLEWHRQAKDNWTWFGWTIWALRRTKLLWVGLALTVPLVESLTNVTCYYYSFCMVAAALVLVRRQIGPPLLVTSGVSQILLYAPNGYYWVDDRYNAQSYLFYAMGLILLFVYSRPFSLARLKAWWDGKPEPKDKLKIFVSTPPRPALPASGS